MPTITPQQLKQKLDAGAVLLVDVREPFEYGDWHIPNSINVPVSRFMHRGFEPDFPKDAEVVTVCAYGFRSETARRILASKGYRVQAMAGGMAEWNGVYDFAEVRSGVYGLSIIQVRRIGKGCLSYIIISGGAAVVIDPTVDVDVYVDAAKEKGAKIAAVLDTHAHADHASGGRMLAKQLPYYAPDEVGAAKHEAIKDGDALEFGSASLSVMATPGHTPGSLVYQLEKFIFTGDTLFTDGVGRPDLGQDAGENAPILFDTVQRLLKLPGDTVILPAHVEIEKIKQDIPVKETLDEIRELSVLKKSKSEFVAWLSGLPTPDNFEIIKQFNTGKIEIAKQEFRELEAGANRCGVK